MGTEELPRVLARARAGRGLGRGGRREGQRGRWDLGEGMPDVNSGHYFSRERSPRPLGGEDGGPGKVLCSGPS